MKPRSLKKLTTACLALAISALSPLVVAQNAIGQSEITIAPAVADMKSLVEQGRFADAFNLGLKNEQLSGDPLYDYYFGISAVDSGRASLGVLALERVLLTNPENDLARLELARGYFVLEDYERSKEEFTILLGKKLPASVQASVEKYLLAIREKDPDFRTVIKGYAEYTIGHNSNVNSSADQLVPFPLFGQSNSPVELDPGKAASSALSQLAFGASTTGPILPGIKYIAAFDGYYRQHSSVDNYDQGLGAVTGGVEFAGEKERYRILGFYSEAYFDNKRIRDTVGAVVDWMRPIDKETTIRSALSYAQLRYPIDTDRDADMPSFSVGFSRFLGGAWKSGLDVDLTVSRESNSRGKGYYSRNVYGVRAVWGFFPGGRWQGSVIGSFSKSHYDDPEPLAPTTNEYKRDELWGAEFGLQYQLTKGWSARGELIYSENRSNVALFRYEQQVALFKMRYEWK